LDAITVEHAADIVGGDIWTLRAAEAVAKIWVRFRHEDPFRASETTAGSRG
jgi:hypothetical protein